VGCRWVTAAAPAPIGGCLGVVARGPRHTSNDEGFVMTDLTHLTLNDRAQRRAGW
jgi:hypothetical protein